VVGVILQPGTEPPPLGCLLNMTPDGRRNRSRRSSEGKMSRPLSGIALRSSGWHHTDDTDMSILTLFRSVNVLLMWPQENCLWNVTPLKFERAANWHVFVCLQSAFLSPALHNLQAVSNILQHRSGLHSNTAIATSNSAHLVWYSVM
jgi:hypothetical protein